MVRYYRVASGEDSLRMRRILPCSQCSRNSRILGSQTIPHTTHTFTIRSLRRTLAWQDWHEPIDDQKPIRANLALLAIS